MTDTVTIGGVSAAVAAALTLVVREFGPVLKQWLVSSGERDTAKTKAEQDDKAQLWARVKVLEDQVKDLNSRIEKLEHEKLDLAVKLAGKEAELALKTRDHEELKNTCREYEEQLARRCPVCLAAE